MIQKKFVGVRFRSLNNPTTTFGIGFGGKTQLDVTGTFFISGANPKSCWHSHNECFKSKRIVWIAKHRIFFIAKLFGYRRSVRNSRTNMMADQARSGGHHETRAVRRSSIPPCRDGRAESR